MLGLLGKMPGFLRWLQGLAFCLWMVRGLSGRLAEIEDDALSQDGVEQVLQAAGETRLLHDVPGEEAVIEIHRR